MDTRNLIFLFLNFALLYSLVQCIYDTEAVSENVGIYGGHEIRITEAPYMASLRLDGKEHFCGASIIHEKFILTAAHCIAPQRHYTVSVGTDDVNGGKIYEIEKMIVHENYDRTTQDYDVCVIKLKGALEFGDSVNKIELAGRSPVSGRMVEVTGWGKTPYGPLSDQLMQVSIPILPSRVCRQTYLRFKHVITPRMFCAGDVGMDSCEADSGGPLTFKNKQIGIVSFGLSVCGVKPGVYTKIKPLKSWILNTIETNL
ncbi:hypothetical protein K1T71_011413 [Dendrolimus kikuchii]|uniref:Uncharacterized protein n=1 Tax=Dendrolimus kikuchii TaxID=765133 RepID=A0ACC1CNV7_9NEOP|nr:hypothetical protein K1T71_011413 [Dendrolimus kikuchii]